MYDVVCRQNYPLQHHLRGTGLCGEQLTADLA